MTTNRRCGGLEPMTYLQRFTARLKVFVAYLRVTAVCDAIDPPSAEERIAAARRQTGERTRVRGVSAVMAASRANVIEFDRRKQLTACCESSPFRKSVQ